MKMPMVPEPSKQEGLSEGAGYTGPSGSAPRLPCEGDAVGELQALRSDGQGTATGRGGLHTTPSILSTKSLWGYCCVAAFSFFNINALGTTILIRMLDRLLQLKNELISSYLMKDASQSPSKFCWIQKTHTLSFVKGL